MTTLTDQEKRDLYGGARIARPLDIGYNVAVRTMSRKLFPTGYDTVEDIDAAPTSLNDLNTLLDGGKGRMVVWSGACENTIFDCPETNMDFRSWHDWAHWKVQAEFDMNGELAAVEEQCRNLVTVYGDTQQCREWQRLVRLDILGTFAHRNITGEYPTNQRAWTEHLIAGLEIPA